MTTVSMGRRPSLALAAMVVGLAACWVAQTPFGLLAPVAALFLVAPPGALRVLYGGLSIAFAVAVVAAFVAPDAMRDPALAWAAVFALALPIGAIVAAAGAAAAPSGADPRIAGLAGAAPEPDAASGQPPSLSLVHPEDRPTLTQAMTYAFWTGVPQVISYRHRLPDGRYAPTAFRADPGYRVGVATDAMVYPPVERWPATGARGQSATDAVHAAKVVESLYGKAWAFDAAGRFVYVTPAAQAAIGMTLDDLNAPVRGGAFIDGGDVGWSLGVHPDDYAAAAAKFRHSLRTGEHWNVEYRMLRATGQYVWHRIAARPVRDGDGRITGWYGTSIDIDIYKKTETALRERERELSQLVNMVPGNVWRLAADGEPTFFNQPMVDYLGLDVAETARPGMTRLAGFVDTIVHPDDVDEFTGALTRSLLTGVPFSTRYRLRRADGVYRWMSSRAEPLRGRDGHIVQWYGLCHDIDDQVQAEMALRRSERHLQRLVDALPVHICCWTPANELSFVSKRYMDDLGIAGRDFAEFARAAHERVHPEDAPKVARTAARCIEAGETFTMRYRRRDKAGVYRWLDGRFEPIRDPDGTIAEWYGISVDIDDLVTTQSALREREQELSQLVDLVPSYLWRLSPDGEPNFFNRRLTDFLGLDLDDVEGAGRGRMAKVIATAVHPEDATRVGEALGRCIATGESFAMTYRLRGRDGDYRWVNGRAEPLRDREGRIVQWYGLSHDIDDQLRAEEALRRSERQLQQMIDAIPTLVWAATPEGEPSYLNRRLGDYVGLTLGDLDAPDSTRLQAAIRNSVHPDDAAAVRAALAHSFSTGETFAMKYRHRRADGAYHWVNGRAEPLRDGDGRVVQWYGVVFDIDEDVRTQEELRRTQERLAVFSQAAGLAELSASIAHEVNQPLAAIVANSHACQRWLTADPPNLERARKTVDRVIRDANAAADVVGRIRALFKRSTQTKACAAIGSVVAEARDLIAEEAARRRISIAIDVEDGLPPVTFDRVQIQQVLINLMRNGIEAMDAVAHARTLAVRVRRTSDLVQTEIRDSGRGVEAFERIFEPFFTTKEDGMGMGLAICRSIVEAHGGRLWAETNEPHGAAFIFTLPVSGKAAA